MKKQVAEIKDIIKALSTMIFWRTEDYLKFNIKQEDI